MVKFQPHQLKKALAGHLDQAEKISKNPKSVEDLLLKVADTISEMKDFNEYTIALREDASFLSEMIRMHQENKFTFQSDTLHHFIAALLYYVAKTDLIFDVVPYIGYADDAAVVSYVLKQFNAEIQEYKDWKTYDLQIA